MTTNESEAARLAEEWAERARQLRITGERLCKWAGERFEEANDADDQAEYWRARVAERERELRDGDAA
jgi:hypothetical protein